MNPLMNPTAFTPAATDWAAVYDACRLQLTGISYAQFIQAPEETLIRLGMEDALEIMATGFLPLLPAQAKVRQEITPPKSDPVGRFDWRGQDHRARGLRSLLRWMPRAWRAATPAGSTVPVQNNRARLNR